MLAVQYALQHCRHCLDYLLYFLCVGSITITTATIQSAQNGIVGVSREVMAGRQLYVYTAYKDMQLFHFTVPPLTSNLTFTFTANDTDACDPRNVTMYVTPSSYPVVAPAGESFPPTLWVERGVAVYPVALVSDDVAVSLSVRAPLPGPWFVAGAVMEDSKRITQAGLVPFCQSWVRIEATYRQDVTVLPLLPSITDQPQPPTPVTLRGDQYYRFYVGPYGFTAAVSITNCTAASSGNNGTATGSGSSLNGSSSVTAAAGCPLVLELTPLALSHHSSNSSTVVNCSDPASLSHHNNTGELAEWTTAADDVYGNTDDGEQCGMVAMVMEDAWHYVLLQPLTEDVVHLQLAVSLQVCSQCNATDPEEPSKSSAHLFFSSSDIRSGNSTVLYGEPGTGAASSDIETDPADGYNAIDRGLLEGILLDQVSYGGNAETASGKAAAAAEGAACWNRHDLVRKTFSGNFVFEYDLAPDSNGSVPLMVNVSAGTPTLLAFALTPFMDLGGTLTVELALYPFLNTSVHHYRLAGCLTSGLRAEPLHHAPCRHGYTLHLNTSSQDGSSGGSLDNVASAVLVPFPDPGPWYLSIAAACYTLGNTSGNTSTATAVPCSTPDVTAIFSVSSSSCISGKCGKYGSCYQYIYAGYIFSTCVCDAGELRAGVTSSKQG